MSEEFAVLDNNGIIETSDNIEHLILSESRIRENNPDIEGDLVFVQILMRSN